jgi:2-dehydropantoate 2-reductase
LLNRQLEDPQCSVKFVEPGHDSLEFLHYSKQISTAIDILWLAVKSYQVEQALCDARPWLTETSKVFLMQNGMGHLETAQRVLAETVPASSLYIVINTHGALLDRETEPVTITHTGKGTLKIGGNYLATNRSEPVDLANTLSDKLNPVWVENIEQALWAKLGINAVINPLTALHQCRNGDLIASPGLLSEVKILVAELNTFYKTIGYEQLAESFSEHCLAVIKATASNYSSMMMDKKLGRPLELDAITGYLLSTADSVRLDLQAHRSLFHRLLKN